MIVPRHIGGGGATYVKGDCTLFGVTVHGEGPGWRHVPRRTHPSSGSAALPVQRQAASACQRLQGKQDSTGESANKHKYTVLVAFPIHGKPFCIEGKASMCGAPIVVSPVT